MKDQFIVAEVSKTWEDPTKTNDAISKQFEKVINTNFVRGYSLKEWKFNSHTNEKNIYTETIVAIFELVK